jgi:hypothetical protein
MIFNKKLICLLSATVVFGSVRCMEAEADTSPWTNANGIAISADD